MEGKERLTSMKNIFSNIFRKKYHIRQVKDVQQAKDLGPLEISPKCTENGINKCLKDQNEDITTDNSVTSDSSSSESSFEYSVNGTDDLPWIQNIIAGTQRTETAFFSTPDNIDDVDSKSITVTCAGKSKIFFLFPAEKISVLLQEACDWAGKKPEKMNLVFDGEQLDVTKAVRECPSLRGGSKVNLIHIS